MMQVNLQTNSGAVVTVGTDSSWSALNGDSHRNPGPVMHGPGSAGTGFLEYIDARKEPDGWMNSGFKPGADWAAAVARSPTAAQISQLHPKMQPPMEVVASVDAVSVKAITLNLPPLALSFGAPPAPPLPNCTLTGPWAARRAFSQVSLQWRNLDFLLKNLHFLIKNLHLFLIQNQTSGASS